MAARNAARIELAKLTGSLGSRAIIQLNTNHDSSTDISIDTPRRIASSTGALWIPSHPNTLPIGVASASALSANVARMATNDDTIAPRSENLVRTKPRDASSCFHISLSAVRRLAIQFRPT